jgi:type I restriction enzyme S subunit
MAGEWKRTSLREAGVTLIDCDHRTPPAADSGYPYIAIPQLKEGRLSLGDVRRISPEHFAEWTRKAKPQHHDVILSRRCNPGETAYVPAGLECALGQNLVLLRADGKKLFPPFLRWLVRGTDWWEQVGTFINVGAVFDSLKCADIPNFSMPLPPLAEQKAIAAVLGALDDKIELNRRMNATLESMARALFQSWFVDFDPVRAKLDGRQPVSMDAATADLFPEHLEDSPLGNIPKGWRVSRLEEIASVMMGLSPDGESYNADGMGRPLINGPVEFGDYFPVKTKWTEAATRFAAEGDLIFCVRGSTTGRRVVSDGEYGIGRGVCAIRANGGYHSFLYQTINVGLDRLLEKTTGSVFPSLSAPDIKGFSVLNPSKSIMEAYERTTKPLIQRIQRNHHESRTLATLRDTLLPKLLSGELTVAEIEKEAVV